MRSPSAWKVEMVRSRTTLAASMSVTRDFISRAALFVKVTATMCFGWMPYLNQRFERVDESRARSIEILIAVGHEYVAVAHRAQRLPLRLRGDGRELAPRACDVKTAGHDHDDVRIALQQRVPAHACRKL